MLKTILIDDEEDALDTLESDLKNDCPEDVQVLGKFQSPLEGMKAIRRLKPDLVFLDIRMPGLDGFELLEILGNVSFHVIFVSGFDEYAIQAFRVSAVDFLVKPVDKQELVEAIGKVRERAGWASERNFGVLLENLSQIQTIALKSRREYRFFALFDIMYCQADGNFSYVYTVSQGDKEHTSYSLSKLGELLPVHLFFRIHASYFINRSHLRRYVKGDSAHVIMQDGARLSVARSRREEFEHWLGFGG